MSVSTYKEEWKLAGTGSRLSTIASLVLGTFLFMALAPYREGNVLYIWYAGLITLTVFSYFHHITYAKQKLKAVYASLALIESCKGFLWLISGFVLFPLYPNDLQLFFVLIHIGAALSYAIARHMIFFISLLSIGVALPVVAWRIILLGEEVVSIELALLAMVGWTLSLILAIVLKINFDGRVRLIQDNELLLHRVDAKMHELEKLREIEQLSRRDAEEANASKSRFLAYSSHDLRQPLHATILLLETINDEGLNPSAQAVIGKVRQSLDNLSNLFDSLLDLAMLDTGEIEVRESIFSLDELLKSVMQEFENVAEAKQIELSYVSTSRLANTDQVIFRRMVQNLVSNAIRYTDEGKVLIGVRSREGLLAIEVWDQGKGIAEDQQQKIFEEFIRLDEKDGSAGLGLGLAIIKKMANALQLDIGLRSRVGVGSMFSISQIKPALDQEKMVQQTELLSVETRAEPEFIAIIDDDLEVLQATEAIVRKWGYSADTYLKFCPDTFKIPDIILCDYELGGAKNGVEVIKEISTMTGDQIPAIIITGDASGEAEAQAAELHVPVLRKPVRPAQLRSLLLATFATPEFERPQEH